VILVAFNVRLPIAWRHQPYFVPKFHQLSPR
jgi:hypothetical protein